MLNCLNDHCGRTNKRKTSSMYKLGPSLHTLFASVPYFMILCSMDSMKTRYEIQDETDEISIVSSAYFLFWKIFQKWFTHVWLWFAHV
jgi:hypothetical protein